MNIKILLLLLGILLAAVVNGAAQLVITNQPQNQTNIAGTTAMFTVGATGAPPLSYQWRSHASATVFTNIPWGTDATLFLTNVQPTARRFAVVVTDAGGLSATSSPLVTLTVLLPPSITNQPLSRVAEVGDNVTLTASAAGTTPLAYQWRLNDTNLAGKTSTNLVLANVQLTNAGSYTLVVTNVVGAATSEVAVLTVIQAAFTRITGGAIVNDGGFSFAASWGDYNDDEFTDLFVCNWPENSGAQRDFLYRNNGDGTFTRTTNAAVSAGRWASGASWGDYDNDGRLDLFVCRPGVNSVSELTPNTLYHNEGNTFTSITTGLIVTEPLHTHAGIWGDFDNDSFLDVVAVNWGAAPPSVPAPPNLLYRGHGDGTFERLSFGTKSPSNGDSWNVAAADFNNDGWLDLCIPQGGAMNLPAQRSQSTQLYANRGDGTFTLLTNNAVVGNRANGVACAWGDYDNDGILDLFVSNFFGQDNFLYHNDGNGGFTLVTNSIVSQDGGTSVGCAWGDYDNDGWLDLFVANLGLYDPNTGSLSFPAENNFLYHNNGDGNFTKVTTGRVANDLGYSTGCAWADYDNDGFIDLFVANGWLTQGQNNFLYHNNANSNGWLTLKLVGTVSNRSAIGAKVRVRASIGGRTFWQMREISGGSNYGSQNDLRPSFGLGNATNVETLRIEWPSGTVQEMHSVAARQFLTITEPPRLTAPRSVTNDLFQMQLTGWPGFTFDFETSSNLTIWTPWMTVTTTNRLTRIEDPIVPTGGQRFYRARHP